MHIVVKNSEYLDALTDYRWKEAYEIKLQIEKKRHGWIVTEDMRISLEKLVTDGLIDQRLSGKSIKIDGKIYFIREFRRRIDWNKRLGISPLNTDCPKEPVLII
jgi:hypothetical protein